MHRHIPNYIPANTTNTRLKRGSIVLKRKTDFEKLQVYKTIHQNPTEYLCIHFDYTGTEVIILQLYFLNFAASIPWISTVDVTLVDVKLWPRGEMRGMTVVNDQLFVVESKDRAVKVYDSHTLTLLRRMNIPDMKDPQGLAGCSHNKALYISDGELECIHRVNLTDNSVKRWRLRENYWPWGLSVTSERNLINCMIK